MIRGLLLGLAVLCCLAECGCTSCASPFDDTYSAFGGRWQRENQVGRVGSVIEPAGVRVDDPAPGGVLSPTSVDVESSDDGQSEGREEESTSAEPRLASPVPIQPTSYEEPVEPESEFDETGKFQWRLEEFDAGPAPLPADGQEDAPPLSEDERDDQPALSRAEAPAPPA